MEPMRLRLRPNNGKYTKEEQMRMEGPEIMAPVEIKPRAKRKWRRILWMAAALCLCALLALGYFRGREAYNLIRHGICTVHSKVDFDHDLIDDYTDLMLGARRYVNTQPDYVSDYFSGGYPPEGQGVCTDVVWRALRAAGYDFKAMIDKDIAKNPSAYPLTNGLPDANIDFRRVVNLKVYMERHTTVLTTDTDRPEEWQPGDFVFYEGHVAIVSDRRNADGLPWIIHHTGRGAFEEDALTYRPITGHYRWTGGAEG